uniref:ubiquitinyl hydrolase 1 n=1 Tax=Lepisosteus oculatus TaxID=7918 RepID=W5NBB7_LEPOC
MAAAAVTASSSAEPPGLETQRGEIEDIIQGHRLRAGDSWYLLDLHWFKQWKEYVHMGDQNSSAFPGRIDNAELFEDLESCRLKERLVEEEDFILVPAEAWRKLLAWYGMAPEQPPLERKVRGPCPGTLGLGVHSTPICSVPPVPALRGVSQPRFIPGHGHALPGGLAGPRCPGALGEGGRASISADAGSPQFPTAPADCCRESEGHDAGTGTAPPLAWPRLGDEGESSC